MSAVEGHHRLWTVDVAKQDQGSARLIAVLTQGALAPRTGGMHGYLPAVLAGMVQCSTNDVGIPRTCL